MQKTLFNENFKKKIDFLSIPEANLQFSDLSNHQIVKLIYNFRLKAAEEVNNTTNKFTSIINTIDQQLKVQFQDSEKYTAIIENLLLDEVITLEVYEEWEAYFKNMNSNSFYDFLAKQSPEYSDVFVHIYNKAVTDEAIIKNEQWKYYLEQAIFRSKKKHKLWTYEAKLALQEFKINEKNMKADKEALQSKCHELQKFLLKYVDEIQNNQDEEKDLKEEKINITNSKDIQDKIILALNL